MVKSFLILAIILTALQTSWAKEEVIVCPLLYVSKVQKIVEERGSFDKFKHCSVSCLLTLRCPAKDVMDIGLLKEFADLLGYGTPEIADMKANMTGIKLVTSKKATTDEACMDQCEKLYPQNFCE